MMKLGKKIIGVGDPIPQENIGDLILDAFKCRPDFIGQVTVSNKKNYFILYGLRKRTLINE